MRLIPKWAQWQADNPAREDQRRSNRRFWYFMAWDVRFALVLSAFLVLFSLLLLVGALLGAFE